MAGARRSVVTGAELESMSERDLDRLLRTGEELVFARSSPEAKLRVADALLARGTGRIKQLVYVDAMVPLPGEGWGAGHPPDIVQSRLALARANDNALPPPDPID